MGAKTSKGFLVKFESVGRARLNWEERIERPVTDAKIVAAVKRKKALASKGIDAQETTDYGGIIFAGDRPAGSYFIVPGSES